jgi:hypothetical protein
MVVQIREPSIRSEEDDMAARKKIKKKAKATATARAAAKTTISTRSAIRVTRGAPPMDDFYADDLTLQRNAENSQERRQTRDAAMVVWRLEDAGTIFRHEADVKWGWALRRY